MPSQKLLKKVVDSQQGTNINFSPPQSKKDPNRAYATVEQVFSRIIVIERWNDKIFGSLGPLNQRSSPKNPPFGSIRFLPKQKSPKDPLGHKAKNASLQPNLEDPKIDKNLIMIFFSIQYFFI
jgi:hypothetical protein